MVDFISNLVKLSDYPFTYSLIALVLIINGHSLDLNALSNFEVLGPLLSLIGIMATVLSITDPFGHLIRWILKTTFYSDSSDAEILINKDVQFWDSHIGDSFLTDDMKPDEKRRHKRTNNIFKKFYDQLVMFFERLQYVFSQLAKSTLYYETISSYSYYLKLKSISTNWVSYEVDKIVSIIYFTVLLTAVLIAINISPFYMEFLKNLTGNNNSTSATESTNMTGLNNNSTSINANINSLWNSITFKNIVSIFVVIAIILMLISVNRSVIRLITNVDTIIIYFYSQEVLIPSIKQYLNNDGKDNSYIREGVEELQRRQLELVNTMNTRDWGIANFLALSFWKSYKNLVNHMLKDKT